MGKTKKDRFLLKTFVERWIQHPSVRFIMYAVLGFIMYLLLMGQVIPETFDLQEGQRSPLDIYSPIQVINEWETNQLKEKAAQQVPDKYSLNDDIINDQGAKLETFFQTMSDIVLDTEMTSEEKRKLISESTIFSFLSDQSIEKIIRLKEDKIKNLQYITNTTFGMVMNNGVKISQLDQAYAKAKEFILANPFDHDEEIKEIAYEITQFFIKPNQFFNAEQTKALREEAKNNVEPVIIKKDELIVKQGDVIDKATYEKLKAVGLLKDTFTLWSYFGLFLLIALMVLLLYNSIDRMKLQIHQDNITLLMVIIILLLTFIGISVVGWLDTGSLTSPIGYLAPVAFGVMLITVLISLRFAILSGAIFSIFSSLIFSTDQTMIFDFRYGFVTLIGSTAGAFAISRIRNRSAILKAGLIVALFNVLSIFVILLLTSQSYTLRLAIESVLYGMIGGIFSAVLTIGFMPFFESVFGILSPIKLIELSNPNHPLLRKLLIETPGTYHHSVIVGNLAESAAEAIGADGLLARVGAYYHDLGKTRRPTFFIENQLNMDNPHDKLSPSLSKNIILAHPKDGVEMLKEYKLPVPIQDIAMQHHGTSLLKYFYHKASKESKHPIPEVEYRYPGPKPQTKEAAIVGIADSVEAAVRSIAHPTNELIEEVVRRVIKDKLDDGQLNECDLTLKELEIIAVSMLETLKGIFHSRIEYPDLKVLEETKGEKTS